MRDSWRNGLGVTSVVLGLSVAACGSVGSQYTARHVSCLNAPDEAACHRKAPLHGEPDICAFHVADADAVRTCTDADEKNGKALCIRPVAGSSGWATAAMKFGEELRPSPASVGTQPFYPVTNTSIDAISARCFEDARRELQAEKVRREEDARVREAAAASEEKARLDRRQEEKRRNDAVATIEQAAAQCVERWTEQSEGCSAAFLKPDERVECEKRCSAGGRKARESVFAAALEKCLDAFDPKARRAACQVTRPPAVETGAFTAAVDACTTECNAKGPNAVREREAARRQAEVDKAKEAQAARERGRRDACVTKCEGSADQKCAGLPDRGLVGQKSLCLSEALKSCCSACGASINTVNYSMCTH